MKNRVFIFLLVIFLPLMAFGQTESVAFNEFIAKIGELENKYRESYNKHDHAQSAKILCEELALSDNLKLPSQEGEKYQGGLKIVKANIFYNLFVFASESKEESCRCF